MTTQENGAPETADSLDERLARDTILISTEDSYQLRLMNDCRWPWIILVPLRNGIEDIDDHTPDELAELGPETRNVSMALKAMGVCTSTNVATLGNVVRQMHWHVVGRKEDDPNWPGPVWGFEKAVPYGREEADTFISLFKKALRDTIA